MAALDPRADSLCALAVAPLGLGRLRAGAFGLLGLLELFAGLGGADAVLGRDQPLLGRERALLELGRLPLVLAGRPFVAFGSRLVHFGAGGVHVGPARLELFAGAGDVNVRQRIEDFMDLVRPRSTTRASSVLGWSSSVSSPIR